MVLPVLKEKLYPYILFLDGFKYTPDLVDL